MSVTSERTIVTQFSGQIEAGFETVAASNTVSPGQMDVVTLSSGTNTVTVPTGGATCGALTIILPEDNTVLITLKGASGDTGIKLHKTDPTSIGLDTTQSTVLLVAATTCIGVRFIWS